MKTAFGSIAFITRCSLPLWVRWHSSTKTKTSPTVGLGWASSSLMNASKSSTSLLAELVDQRAEQARRGLAELAHQVAAAAGAVDRLARVGEDALDLLVQLVAVGDDGDAGVGVVLQNPLGQQHHDDALAAALRVPDDAALAGRATCSCAALMPKYWCARGSFFMPPSKSTKSCISSISRSLRHILSRYLSSLKRLLSCLVFLPLAGSTSPACRWCRSAGPRSRCRRRRTAPC